MTVSLAEDGQTKAGDATIHNVTLFVYQKKEGQDKVLYNRIYTENPSSVSFELLFSNQESITYDVNVYANMGNIQDVPSGQNLVDEDINGFRLYGYEDDIDEDDKYFYVYLKRYVNKISVSSINLMLPEVYSEARVILKSIYLAKVKDSFANDHLANEDGYHTATELSPLIYKEFDTPLVNGQQNDVSAQLYCYGKEARLIVCLEINGDVSYYTIYVHWIYSGNNHTDYILNIYQEGAKSPLQSLPAISFHPIANNKIFVNDYDTTIEFEDLGKDSRVIAKILAVDGTQYETSEWYEAEATGAITDADAVGVVVTDGEHSFVIHPTESAQQLKWSSSSVYLDNVFSPQSDFEAIGDFAGEANTDAILAALEAGTINDAPAAVYCDGVVFAHGKKGYLPSAGELRLCYQASNKINLCMSAIGATKLNTGYYWSSTRKDSSYSWRLSLFSQYIEFMTLPSVCNVRAVSAL